MSFEIFTDSIRITDPALDKSQAPKALKALPGEWTYGAGFEEDKVIGIWANHKSKSIEDLIFGSGEAATFYVEVTSGRIGLFDEAFYPNDPDRSLEKEKSFYSKCLKATKDKGFGTIGFGMLANAENGIYECTVIRNSDEKVIAFNMSFCNEPEDIDSEDWDDEFEDDDDEDFDDTDFEDDEFFEDEDEDEDEGYSSEFDFFEDEDTTW